MKQLFTKGHISVFIIFSVLIIDQLIKIWVKTNMYWHDSIHITDWFYIFFTENNGMAFGMEIFGKLFLTIFRIVAVSFIAYYLYKVVKHGYKTGFIVCLSLILSGAIGNIIDSVFYGVIFSESTNATLGSFVPIGEGYSTWLYGKVVDMFYFPIIDTTWPSWIPFVGENILYSLVRCFNFADAAISCGIIAMLLFYSKSLNDSFHTKDKDEVQIK